MNFPNIALSFRSAEAEQPGEGFQCLNVRRRSDFHVPSSRLSHMGFGMFSSRQSRSKEVLGEENSSISNLDRVTHSVTYD